MFVSYSRFYSSNQDRATSNLNQRKLSSHGLNQDSPNVRMVEFLSPDVFTVKSPSVHAMKININIFSIKQFECYGCPHNFTKLLCLSIYHADFYELIFLLFAYNVASELDSLFLLICL